MEFSLEDRNTLISIAKWSIHHLLETGGQSSLPDMFKISDALKLKVGAFVTVYVNEHLRGCIGTFSESEQLYRNVRQMAIQAAFEDHRFKPVQLSELENMRIEISVLSPREKIMNPMEINIGKHGIYMIHGYRKATLLPQVAVENHFSTIEFLECCAKNKLGLSKDSWREAELYVYEAIVIK